jgi:hypothetical protein
MYELCSRKSHATPVLRINRKAVCDVGKAAELVCHQSRIQQSISLP